MVKKALIITACLIAVIPVTTVLAQSVRNDQTGVLESRIGGQWGGGLDPSTVQQVRMLLDIR